MVNLNSDIARKVQLKFLTKSSAVTEWEMFDSNSISISAHQESDLFLKQKRQHKTKNSIHYQ